MAGSQLRATRTGSPSERLAEYFLSSIAFTAPVPRQEDIGHDFYCVLTRRLEDEPMVFAGPSFTVQVKSREEKLRYKSEAEQAWIASQENPFFVCFADPRRATFDLYSTCALVPGVMHNGTSETILEPGVLPTGDNIRKDDNGVLHIPLGPPVLSLKVDDMSREEDLAKWAEILEPWIAADRQNIVNRAARIHWVHWPVQWEANKLLNEDAFRVGFYWNARNIFTTRTNLLRASTLLRLEMQRYEDHGGPLNQFADEERQTSIDALLEAHWSDLGPSARMTLRDATSKEWPAEPDP